jgi:sarcosine oxidase
VPIWDVIVVGLGAVGASAMRAASELGARVLGLELDRPAHARASSHGHSRIFRHAYFEHPDYVPLLRHSTGRFESLEREASVSLLHRCGVLLIGGPHSTIVGRSLETARAWGLVVDELDGPAVAERFPWFARPQETLRAIFERDAGLVRSEAAIHAALAVAATRDAEVSLATRVHAVHEDGSGVVVSTSTGDLRARTAIVAAGAWSAGLLPELAPFLRVTRQVQAWVAPAATPHEAVADTTFDGMPCWLVDRGTTLPAIYGLPPDGLAQGPPALFPKVAFHGSEAIVDPDAGAAPVTAADTDTLLHAYAEVAPRLAGSLVSASTCMYTMSPDGDFLVGTARSSPRIHYAAGLSGHGFKLSPALGDALAQLALTGRTDLPVKFLSPARLLAQ